MQFNKIILYIQYSILFSILFYYCCCSCLNKKKEPGATKTREELTTINIDKRYETAFNNNNKNFNDITVANNDFN